jgi:hypothetical protein
MELVESYRREMGISATPEADEVIRRLTR